jgi:S-DNA-T family DNA segregation ATPase FtsK/SpoIIIE
MLEHGADKIMPAPELPEVILVVDEFKSLPDSVKDRIELIADNGRTAAVRLVLSSLDPTAAGIPTAIVKQCRERYGLRMRDEGSLYHLFDGGGAWTSRFDPRSMTHPGDGSAVEQRADPVPDQGVAYGGRRD